MSGHKDRIILDCILLFLLFLLMSYHIYGETAHEVIGTLMLICTLIHNIKNRRWYGVLAKGGYSVERASICTINLLLVSSMLMVGISGIILSQKVFSFLPIDGNLRYGRALHMLGSYWGYVLTSIHLGFHILPLLNKHKKALLFIKIISIYGIYAFIKRGFPVYMFLRSEFVFFDYNENPLLFYFDYLSIMILWVLIAYEYLMILKKRRENR